ncbi:MAG: sulfatase-like hydrolase/transferase [Leptospirales bacterium]|nr:sulfatase-like hydrolase/transferase [Leptospirales bacterium]
MAIKKTAFWIAAAWLLLIFHRLLFLVIYYQPNPWQQIVEQWLFGLRFDLATIPVIAPILLILPLYHLARAEPRLAPLLRLLEFGQWILLGFVHLILIGSAFNFSVNDKHLGWEFYAYFTDLPTLLASVEESNPWLFSTFLLQIPLWLALGVWLVLRRGGWLPAHRAAQPVGTMRPAAAFALHLAATLPLLLVALRGGWQESPLRPPDAMRKENVYLNNLPLNGAFTVSRDSRDREEEFRNFDEQQNIERVQSLIDRPQAFVSARFPALRYMPANAAAQNRPNFVFLILESYTARYLQEHGGDPRTAPNLQKLIEGGRYYRRFFSTGGRSANGIYAIFGGFPDRSSRTILRSTEIQDRLGGMGGLLGKLGYSSLFIYGGDLTFDNLDRFVPRAGFQRTISDRELHAAGLNAEGTAWGFDDRDTLQTLLQNMDRTPQPFLAALFTLNTHHPYLQPGPGEAIYDESTPQHLYLNSYHYSDRLIGQFFEEARKRPYFRNTIFILVADHAHHTDLSYLDDRHIPLLIYAPGRIAPARIEEVASQIDLLPSVLHLAGGGVYYSSMGRDLFAPPTQQSYAFYSGANVIGWIEGDYLLIRWPSVKKQTLLTARYPASDRDFSAQQPEILARYLENAQRYYQFARTLQQTNRLWPDAATLQELEAQRR